MGDAGDAGDAGAEQREIRVLLVSGSVRQGSVNQAVLETVERIAPPGVTAVVFEGIGELPHFNPDLDRDPLPASVVALRAAIAASDAMLFSTPEYGGMMPGALKNLLEWTIGGVETTDKPTGWINPSTNPAGAIATYDGLRIVLEYTGVRLVPEACIAAPVDRSVIDAAGLITDEPWRARALAALCALAAAARA